MLQTLDDHDVSTEVHLLKRCPILVGNIGNEGGCAGMREEVNGVSLYLSVKFSANP